MKIIILALAIASTASACGNKNDTSAADDMQSNPAMSPINAAGDSTSGVDTTKVLTDGVH